MDALNMISYLQDKGVDLSAALSRFSKCDSCDERKESVMYHHDVYEYYMSCEECYQNELEIFNELGYNPYSGDGDPFGIEEED
jgi:hypothetical protein